LSTATVVSEIKLKAPNWSRDGARSILAMMNRAQNYLFSRAHELSVYIDPLTGDFPLLATTATQYDYEIPNVSMTIDDDTGAVPIRIHHVDQVFSEGIRLSDYGISTIKPYMVSIDGNNVKWRFASRPALENKKCRVSFQFDPGTHTDRYFYKAIIEPLQLTSDAIPLMVQQDDEEALIEGALGWIEYFDYGRSDRLDRFKKEMAPAFFNKYKGLESTRVNNATPRRKF